MRVHYGISGLLRKADYDPTLPAAQFKPEGASSMERTFRFSLPFSGMLRGIRWARCVEEAAVEVTFKVGEDGPATFNHAPAEVVSVTPMRILVAKDERIELVCRHMAMHPVPVSGMLTIDLDDQEN